jgi:hypothetical protein
MLVVPTMVQVDAFTKLSILYIYIYALTYVSNELDREPAPDGDERKADALINCAPNHRAALHGHVGLYKY